MSKNVERYYQLNTAPDHIIKEHWNRHIISARNNLEAYESTVDLDSKEYEIRSTLAFKRSYVELIEKAVQLEQYRECSNSCNYEPVTRMLKIRLDLTRPLIEKYFNLETVSLYGIGLYAPIEGIMLPESFRVSSRYDESLSPLKDAPIFNISSIPTELRKEYDFRLTIPAMQGLFVPKKCRMTKDWIGSTNQLEYFDLMLGL